MPRGLRGRDIDDLDVPAHPGRSWLLLLGVIPFDYDDLGIEEIGPGHRFLERSTMLSMSAWEHERTVTPSGDDACRVSDRVAFELRAPLAWVPGADRVARVLIARVFARRHRRLRMQHGAGS